MALRILHSRGLLSPTRTLLCHPAGPALARFASDHVVTSDNKLGIHSKASKSGMRKKDSDQASHPSAEKHSTGTSGQDVNKSADKIKKENPEAPDSIGMQDERGGKGA